VIALCALGVLAVVFIVWVLIGSEKEFAVYEEVERDYQSKMELLVGKDAELSKDPSAYVVRSRENIAAAREEIAAARKTVKTLEPSTDRADYLSTLAQVDASLAILEQLGSAQEGPEELAVAIDKAMRPVIDGNEAVVKASDALLAKDYDLVIAQGKIASDKAVVAEPLLAALENEVPGIGVADLKDAASVMGKAGEAFVEIGKAYKSSDNDAIQSSGVRLDALSGKYQGAFKRSTASAAWALWSNPGTALQDTFRALESAAAKHAKVYQRIENGE
jgi:hypothetical protein